MRSKKFFSDEDNEVHGNRSAIVAAMENFKHLTTAHGIHHVYQSRSESALSGSVIKRTIIHKYVRESIPVYRLTVEPISLILCGARYKIACKVDRPADRKNSVYYNNYSHGHFV